MMKTPLRLHIPSTFIAKQIGMMTFAAFLCSLGINLFLVPHGLVKGGLSGLALLASHFLPLPIWGWILLFNIPVFALGARTLGHRFLLASIYGIVIFSFCVFATSWLSATTLVHNELLASIFGGAFAGIGVGLALRVNGSLGGTDIISAVLQKQFSLSVGTTSFITNLFIVLLTGTLLGTDVAAYAILSIFIEALAIDKTIRGINVSKGIFIISEKSDEISDLILSKLERGVTFLHGEGAFEKNSKKVLYCVVSLRQLARVKFYVQQVDPKAFMSITDVEEVLGKGFRSSPF